MISEPVTGEGLYRLGDPYPAPEGMTNMIEVTKWRRNLRGKWTGEHREPRKGEWFISGSMPTAYRAQNDMAGKYPIAKIVRVEEVTIVREVGDP